MKQKQIQKNSTPTIMQIIKAPVEDVKPCEPVYEPVEPTIEPAVEPVKHKVQR